MSRENFYEGMTVLITGGSSGFGREFARQLAPRVDGLWLVALDEVGLEETRKLVRAENPRCEVELFVVDLANAEELDAFCDGLRQRGRPIHFLINNAGLGDVGRFASADPEKLRRIFEVNVRALTLLTRRVLPLMPKEGKRAILNVSSLGGIFPAPFLAAYGASKAYVSSFTEALRLELRGKGIVVTMVCPGPVETGFGAVANRDGRRALPAPVWLKGTPRKVVEAALRGVERDRARVFPGWPTATLAFGLSLIPMGILRWMLARRAKG